MNWEPMKAFTCTFSSDELENFSSGGGNFKFLCCEDATKSIDALGLRCGGFLVTRTLQIGPVKIIKK